MDDLDLGATIKGFSPGQKLFNRYVLRRILGRGGMGVVWLAADEELEREVALKFLPEIVALDPEALSDLKRETRRNLELTHPHIVRIYDFVADARTAAISMEFVDGATLTALKLERPGRVFSIAELRPWLLQLMDALHYAHTRPKIVHRDLKPANLMITRAGDLKVTDFGIARGISDSVSRVSVQAGSSGTPVYMSPQQMMGEKPAVADDVYALGATLYELLTGKPPFYSGNVILQVQSKVAPALTERRAELGVEGEPIPPEWERTIAACLAKVPSDRPASVRAIAVGLGLIEGAPAPAEPPPAPAPAASAPAAATSAAPGKPANGAGKMLRAGAIVLALAAVASAGWWFGVHRPEQRRRELQAEATRQQQEAELVREREQRRDEAIRRNLRQLSAAADQYMLETGYEFAPITQLVGPGRYISQLPSVAGESYLGIGSIRSGGEIVITTATGVRFVYDQGSLDVRRSEVVPAGDKLAEPISGYPRELPVNAPWTNSLGMKFVPVEGSPALLVAVWETRVQDFEAFVRETGQDWKRPSFRQGPLHPAVNVTWDQARAFCAWLTDKERAAKRIGTNQRYRLPTDAEWSRAVGLPAETGKTPQEKDSQVADVYPWTESTGQKWPPPPKAGNFPDESLARAGGGEFYGTIVEGGYDDGFADTAPVGSYPALRGLHDVSGNVWEWCEDQYAPAEPARVLRGGSFKGQGFYLSHYLLSSYRNALQPDEPADDAGFRIVLEPAGATH